MAPGVHGKIVDLAGNTTLGLSNNDDDSVPIGRGKKRGNHEG